MNKEDKLEKDLRALGKTFEMGAVAKQHLDSVYDELKVDGSKIWHMQPVIKYASWLLVLIIGFGVVGTCHPVLAENIPVLYRLFTGLNKTVFKDTPYEKYAEPKTLTVTDNYLEVTLEEIFCDQREFGYTYTIKSTKDKLRKRELEYEAVDSSCEIKIDGQVFEKSTIYGRGKYIDDYTYTGKVIYESQMLLPNQFELSLNFRMFKSRVEESFEVTGKWEFKTVVTKHTNPYSKVVESEAVLQVMKPTVFEIQVDEVGFTPLKTYISMKAEGEEISEALNNWHISFTLIDNLGQVYLSQGGGMSRNAEGVYEWLLTFSVPEEVPSWIAIVPSIVPYDEEGWIPEKRVITVAYEETLPITLKREGAGDFIIEEVMEIEDEVTVKVREQVLQNSSSFSIQLKDGSEVVGEEEAGENGEIIWYFTGCQKQDIAVFKLEDNGQKFDLNQMLKLQVE